MGSETTNIHENKQWTVTQVAKIMGTLVQHKCQMVSLEVECNMLQTMMINMSKGYHLRGIKSSPIFELKLWKDGWGRNSAPSYWCNGNRPDSSRTGKCSIGRSDKCICLLLVFMYHKVIGLPSLFYRIYTFQKYWVIFPLDIIWIGC